MRFDNKSETRYAKTSCCGLILRLVASRQRPCYSLCDSRRVASKYQPLKVKSAFGNVQCVVKFGFPVIYNLLFRQIQPPLLLQSSTHNAPFRYITGKKVEFCNMLTNLWLKCNGFANFEAGNALITNIWRCSERDWKFNAGI